MLQYLYPTADIVTNNWLNDASGVTIWSYIDEGVSTPDGNFVFFSDAAPSISGVNRYIDGGDLYFEMGELNVRPNLASGSILINLRAKAPSGEWSFGNVLFEDNVGNEIARYTGLTVISSGNTYNNYAANFNDYSAYLGSWDDYDLTNTKLVFPTALPSGIDYIDAQIDALEIVSTGNIFVDGDTPTLYIPGAYSQDGMTLYLQTRYFSSGGIPLWVGGAFTQGHIPLYMRGLDSGNIDMDLYVGGHITVPSSTPLFMYGHDVATGVMPLYIDGRGDELTDDITLYTAAITTGSGYLQKAAPLYISGLGQNESLNLFLKVDNYDDVTTNMPLFIKRAYEWDNANCDLFLANTLTTSGIPLYMCGPSGTDGAIPINETMPLYMARSSESLTDGITLYMPGPSSIYDGIDLYMSGGPSLSRDLDLYIFGEHSPTSGIELYTHGF